MGRFRQRAVRRGRNDMGLDWEDIIIHAAVALVACGLLMWFMPSYVWHIAALNAMIWGIREWWQDVEDGDHPRPWPFRWAPQKWAEFLAPAAIGVVLAAGFSLLACGEVACV